MVHRGEGIRVTVQQIRIERSYWDLRLGLVQIRWDEQIGRRWFRNQVQVGEIMKG